MQDPYRPHDHLVDSARPTATLDRLMLGIIFTVVLFFSLLFCASAILGVILPAENWNQYGDTFETGDSPIGVLANLYGFVFVIAALALAARNIHNRSLQSIFGNTQVAFFQFKRVCLYLLGLYFALAFFLPSHPEVQPEPNVTLGQWILLLPLAVPALLIQTSAEELVFRGYLQSQLAARFASPSVWIILPSAVFGLLHYNPDLGGDNAWVIVTWATAFGILAADITARAGTLGPAIALHFMNNALAILVTAPKDNFDGLALFSYPFSLDDTDAVWQWAPVDLMVLFVSWLTIRLALKR